MVKQIEKAKGTHLSGTDANNQQKKPYVKPVLARYGVISKVTQGFPNVTRTDFRGKIS